MAQTLSAIAASANIELGDGSSEVISTYIIQIVGSGWTGSVTIKGRVRNTSAGYVAIAYVDRSDDTSDSAAITADALVEVNASGLDIRLDITIAAGTVTIYTEKVLG